MVVVVVVVVRVDGFWENWQRLLIPPPPTSLEVLLVVGRVAIQAEQPLGNQLMTPQEVVAISAHTTRKKVRCELIVVNVGVIVDKIIRR